jgi:hypothetical protein
MLLSFAVGSKVSPAQQQPNSSLLTPHLPAPSPTLAVALSHADAGWQRYKYAVQVFIGEQRGEGCRCGHRQCAVHLATVN